MSQLFNTPSFISNVNTCPSSLPLCYATLSSISGEKSFSCKTQGLIDSGSSVNCVSRNILPEDIEIFPCENSVQLFNGQISHVSGYIMLKINFGHFSIQIRASVIENLSFGPKLLVSLLVLVR